MKIHKRKGIKLLVVLLVSILVLAACGAGNNGGADTGAPEDRIIRVGVSGVPDIDPAIAITSSSTIAVANLYDALVFPGPGDTLVPHLALSWDISADGLTYTFNLRQGVQFADGGRFTARDVAFSMNRKLAIGEGFAYLFVDFVDSVEVVSDYVVAFHLSQPYGPFLNALIRLMIVSEDQVMANIQSGIHGEFGDFGRTFLNTNSAGTGPFRAVELVHLDFFHAERNENWWQGWGDRPYAPTGFRMMAITEGATVYTMMVNRQLDITDQWQSTENLDLMSAIDGVTIAEYSTFLVQNMYMNTRLAPMDCIYFRRAIASLFDFETIVNDIFINSPRSTGPVAAGVAGQVSTNVLPFSIEAARGFLEQSIYADTFQNYTLDILVNSDVAVHERLALLFQFTAGQVGINVSISRAPWVAIIDRMGSIETSPHLTTITVAPPFNDAGVYLETRFHSKTAGTWTQGEWLLDPELDAMIEAALSIVDQNERFAAYAALQHHIVDNIMPTIWLVDLTERLAFQSGTITWPFIEQAGFSRVLDGFQQMYAEMQIRR